MALRHRKEAEEIKLKGVDRVDEEADLELGQFTALQNLIPADVYSLRKKRGVLPLNPTGLAYIITEGGDFLTAETGDLLQTEV